MRRPVDFRSPGCRQALGQPGFDLGQIPHHTAPVERKATREFAALFHLVDGGVGQRYDLQKLMAAIIRFLRASDFVDITLLQRGWRLMPIGADRPDMKRANTPA